MPDETVAVAGLPAPATAFVGRDAEVRELLEMLARPSCRLVTLLGPGGVGKTRLAIEAARRWVDESAFEAAFVPLESVAEPEAVAPEVASALGIRGIGSEEPVTQLLRVLGSRELLLVLDNFEHVLEGAGLIAELLEGAPGLTLLVTSREALNLSSEWRYTVHGLPVPADRARPDETLKTESVQLFDERARRVDPRFKVGQHVEHVARICRLVDGVPLAIELASSWTSSLTCREIADEITQQMDFLATNRRDVPERHRSVRAVFDQSWKRLSREEHAVFSRLSVFRGGFGRDAAEIVAGATLAMLTTFVDRSLVWKDADGRFHMHDMLSQYAAEQSDGSPALEETRDRHAEYYVRMASGMLEDLLKAHDLRVNEAIVSEYENLTAAIERAVSRRMPDGLREALHAFSLFHQLTARYGDGVRQREPLVREIEKWASDNETRYLLASVLVDLAWLYIRVGRIEDAERTADRALNIYDDLRVPLPRGSSTDPVMVHAFVALIRGKYARAEELSRRGLERAKEEEAELNVPYGHFGLSEAAYRMGRYEESLDDGLRALETARAVGDRWFEAYVLNLVGTSLAAMGDKTAAREQFERSYAIRREFGDPEGMAVALNHLGDLALREANHAQALRRFEESLGLYRDLDDVGGRAATLRGLGEACTGLGRFGDAARHLGGALVDAAGIRFVSAVLSTAVAAARLLVATGRGPRAAEVLAWVRAHPGSGEDVLAAAREAEESLPAWRESGVSEQDLASFVDALGADLAAIEKEYRRARQDSLAEPLTEREVEVLACMAEGLSNRQIAERLVLSPGTVKAHTHNIYGKLGAENRVQAISRAREAGVIEP